MSLRSIILYIRGHMLRIGISFVGTRSSRGFSSVRFQHRKCCIVPSSLHDASDEKATRTYLWYPHRSHLTRQFSTECVDAATADFAELIEGPPTQFGFGRIATLTEASVIGTAGETVTLTTVATAPSEEGQKTSGTTIADLLRQKCRASSSFVPLTVDYRQRYHAVGKIPTNMTRSDNKRPTDAETLASRAIDRALRPLLRASSDSVHVSCSIQACPLDGLGGYPVALALNSAAVALRDRLKEPVACVYLSMDKNGNVQISPVTKDDHATAGLLYAGTRENVVMMEFSGMLEESGLESLITLAHACIQPILDVQEEARDAMIKEEASEDALTDELLLRQLDLPNLPGIIANDNSNSTPKELQTTAETIYAQTLDFCSQRLFKSALKLFGHPNDDSGSVESCGKSEQPKIHSDSGSPLLSKAHRGRREHLFRQAVASSILDLQKSMDGDVAKSLGATPSLIDELADAIHSELLKKAMAAAAVEHRTRADNRSTIESFGCSTIRPISLQVPVLPDSVHGSALFTRGETQVLCTATLGPPSDGIPRSDPFARPEQDPEREPSLSDDLPVGSLRYLKTQEYLESDLNSRKVRADREQTGDSGTLRDKQRAFLQYDFPAFGKGEIQSGPRGTNRREVGHGALAEKAILPILPPPDQFPYAIRMSSEVTGSNGSSSMASVCGATMALLDAGVPIQAPVAGLSVGLVKHAEQFQLLVDITGTEDHYGLMDAKIAGTYDCVTAIHMDVHEPLPLQIVFDALRLAKASRGVLLDEMKSQAAMSSDWGMTDFSPRTELKASAPRVEVVRFDPMRKKDLLGPGGSVIRQMEDRFNVSLDLTQEGQCLLFGDDQEMVAKARVAVMDLVSDVEAGETYEGTVIEIRDFGIVVELLRNKEGLCHVSEMASRDDIRNHPEGSIGLINSLVQIGQKIQVECITVDQVMGTIRLRPASRKGYSNPTPNG